MRGRHGAVRKRGDNNASHEVGGRSSAQTHDDWTRKRLTDEHNRAKASELRADIRFDVVVGGDGKVVVGDHIDAEAQLAFERRAQSVEEATVPVHPRKKQKREAVRT